MLNKRATGVLGDASCYVELLETYPRQRPVDAHEITILVVFLASFRSGCRSGTIVTVDGGISSRRSII